MKNAIWGKPSRARTIDRDVVGLLFAELCDNIRIMAQAKTKEHWLPIKDLYAKKDDRAVCEDVTGLVNELNQYGALLRPRNKSKQLIVPKRS